MRRSTSLGLLTAILAAGLTYVSPAGAHTEELPYIRKDVQRRGLFEGAWGAMARDRAQLERVWDRFNLRGDPPTIRFRKDVAVIAGTTGTSSCPARIRNVRLNHDRQVIVVRLYKHAPEGVCTDDIAPRTFTLSIARADLRPLRARDLRVVARKIDHPTT